MSGTRRLTRSRCLIEDEALLQKTAVGLIALISALSPMQSRAQPAAVSRAQAALVAQCPPWPTPSPAEADALPIHVTRWGDTGPVVLLIHGGVQGDVGGGPSSFARQKPISQDGFQLLLPDRPGFGQSPTRGPDNMENESVWIARMMDGGVNLIGHSWGGADALLAAARQPEKVRSLILIEPAMTQLIPADPELMKNPVLHQAVAERAQWLLAAKTPADFMRSFAATVTGAGKAPPALAAVLNDPQKATASGCALIEGKVATAAETRAAAATVAQAGIPVLVVTGGWSPARDMEGDIIAKLTHGRHVIVRSPSHFVQAANAAEFNKVAVDFMREADKTRNGQ